MGLNEWGKGNTGNSGLLRKKAEDSLKENSSNFKVTRFAKEVDTLSLIHELQVHQVELEMQNDELIKTRDTAERLKLKYESLFDFASIGYFVINREGKILEINFSGAGLLGIDRSNLVNKDFKFFLKDNYRKDFYIFLKQAFEKHIKVSAEVELSLTPMQKKFVYIEGIVLGENDNCLTAIMDITQRRIAEEEVQNLNITLESRVREQTARLTDANKMLRNEIILREEKEILLKRLNRTLNAMRRSSEAVSRSKSEKEFLDEVCKIIIEDCGHSMVWIGFKEDDVNKSILPVAYAGFEEGYIETLKLTWADTERGHGPTGTAIRTGKPSFCKNMLIDPRFKPWRQEAIKRGYASSIVIPLIDGEIVFGALTIYFTEPDPFSEDEVSLLKDLAADLSFGIKTIRMREARKKAELALQESEAKAKALIKYAPTGIYEIDFRGPKLLTVNDAMCDILGYTREELLKTDPNSLLDAESRVLFMHRVKRQLAGDKLNAQVEFRVIAKDGRKIDALLNISFGIDAGNPYKALVVAHDITERKKMEDELQRFNKLSVGRELRMIELKKEVNAMAQKAGLEPPYNLDFEKNSLNDDEKGAE